MTGESGAFHDRPHLRRRRDLERAARFYEAPWRRSACHASSRARARSASANLSRILDQPARRHGARPAESGTHICLRAKATADVDAFHAAALSSGGRSDGAPGLRRMIACKYYAAFVIDPDGNRIEAVTFPGDERRA
jgi:hypothetical protein